MLLTGSKTNEKKLEELMQPGNIQLDKTSIPEEHDVYSAEFIGDNYKLKELDDMSIYELSSKGLLADHCEESPYFESILETESIELNNVRHPICRECSKTESCCKADCEVFDEMYFYYEKGKMESSNICMHCEEFQYSLCGGIDHLGTCDFETVDLEHFKEINPFIYKLASDAGMNELSKRAYIISRSGWKQDFRLLKEVRNHILREPYITETKELSVRFVDSKIIISSEGKSAVYDTSESGEESFVNNSVPGYQVKYLLRYISFKMLFTLINIITEVRGYHSLYLSEYLVKHFSNLKEYKYLPTPTS